MENQSNEPTHPMEPPTAEEEVGQTRESTLEDPEGPMPGKRPLSDEMRKTIQELLKTEIGDGLCKRLSAMARLDLHKGQMNVTWIEDQQCLDVRTPVHDLSPLLYESLRAYTWNHNMAMRIDDMTRHPHIICRWFLPALVKIETVDPGHEQATEPPDLTPRGPHLNVIK